MPPYPYGPNESLLDLPGFPPHPPSRDHPFGTDDRGRDVLVRLAYGFNISLTFALLVLVFADGIGIVVGAVLGYFGGKLDIFGQRVIEIWSSLPFLYTIIIVSSIVVPVYMPGRMQVLQPSFWLLVVILAAFDWMGITYYVRGEFYREKAKDYVGAAIATGVSEPGIMFRHILPNALTPVVSFAPFTIVANIGALVALDFLGFGLPAPTPSWGELIGQGMDKPDEVVAGASFRSASCSSRCCWSSSSAKRCAKRSIRRSTRGCDDDARCCRSAASAPTSSRKPASPRPSTASTSTSCPGEVLGLVGESGLGQERHRAEHPAADPRSAGPHRRR